MQNNPQKSLEYKVHPMGESIVKTIIFWTVVIFTIWGVRLNVDSLLLTFVAGAILIASLNSFYLPTYYRIDEEGASWRRATGSRKISWERVRRVSDERDGMFLSPFAGRTMMENFRGLYLPYRNNRAELIDFVHLFAPDATGLEKLQSTAQARLSEPPRRNYFGHRR